MPGIHEFEDVIITRILNVASTVLSVNEVAGRVGIGTTTPSDLFEVNDGANKILEVLSSGPVIIGTGSASYGTTGASDAGRLAVVDDVTAAISVENYSETNANASIFELLKSASGTVGTLAETGNGEVLGDIRFSGVNNAGTPLVKIGALIRAEQTGSSGTTGIRSKLTLGASNQDGVRSNMLVLDGVSDGTGIGIASPTAKLHVDQFSTSAAIPVLILDQADLSEEMIEFITTIGVGNPIEAIAAKSLTTTHFIRVTLPGGLARYIPCGTIA